MKIAARVVSRKDEHDVIVSTGGAEKRLTIPPRTPGGGSSVNGGELLFLALATCYCNDVYREAARRGVEVTSVEVAVSGEFGAEGEAARQVEYSARVTGSASEQELLELMAWTDGVAEIQRTVRDGMRVVLKERAATTTAGG